MSLCQKDHRRRARQRRAIMQATAAAEASAMQRLWAALTIRREPLRIAGMTDLAVSDPVRYVNRSPSGTVRELRYVEHLTDDMLRVTPADYRRRNVAHELAMALMQGGLVSERRSTNAMKIPGITTFEYRLEIVKIDGPEAEGT